MHALIPYCTSVPSPTFYQDFIEGLEEALVELGHSSERFAFREIGTLAQDELERFHAWSREGVRDARTPSRCDLVLDPCCWGFALSRLRLWDGASEVGATVLDALGARYAGLLFDQPYFQPVPMVVSDAFILAYPDRDHPELIRSLYPSVRPAAMLFAPPATRPANDHSPARWHERRIPLLYAGNLAPGATEPFWGEVPQRRLYDGAAALVDSRPDMPLHRAIEEVRGSLGLALEQEERLEVHRTLEFHLRHRLRHRMVTALARAGLPIEVYGDGWDSVGLPANARVHPEMDYTAYKRLIGDTRICLDASTYLNGANDRVVQFAINGTVFFSNAQAYLREAFGDDAGFYSPLDLAGAAERIREWLARPGELEARSARLRERALNGHLWRHRLEALFAAMRRSG